MSDYNYAVFDLAREEVVFDTYKRTTFAGQRAASFPVEDLASGETVEMSSLWATGPAVLEFGSLT